MPNVVDFFRRQVCLAQEDCPFLTSDCPDCSTGDYSCPNPDLLGTCATVGKYTGGTQLMVQEEPNRAACVQACISDYPDCDYWSYNSGTGECTGFTQDVTEIDATDNDCVSGDRLCKIRE